jgi:ATP-binding cassette subfamily B (MDR/TAP) protein 1
LIRDSDGAYSQLVRLQGGAEAENTETSDTDNKAADTNLDLDKANATLRSHRRSLVRSLSRGSSGSFGSFTMNYAVPSGPISLLETKEIDEEDYEITKMDIEKRRKVSTKRLAYLNKPEIPVLLVGSLGAAVQGVIFPIFGLLLSSAIGMFFEPPSQLRKDSRYWASVYASMGCIALVAIPIQNYFFGIAGGKLIQRIRSMTFEKIVHQQISWFDDPANSRCVKHMVILMCFLYLKLLNLHVSLKLIENGEFNLNIPLHI